MDKEHYRKLVWESLLAADYRARYFGFLAGRLRQNERRVTVIVGALSSGAFVS